MTGKSVISALAVMFCLAATAAFAAVSMDQAQKIALADAKVPSARFTKTKLDFGDFGQKYELKFNAGGYKYEYEILSETGEIVEKSAERIGWKFKQVPAKKSITPAQAQEIAFKHAGKRTEAVGYELDREGVISVYEIKFFAGGWEYEYDINAAGGEICKYSWERKQ